MVKRKDITTDEKTTIFHFLLEGSNGGRPKYGKMKEVSLTYGCAPRCVSRIWTEALSMRARGVPVIFKNKKRAAIRPKKHVPDLEFIRNIEPHLRQYIRDLAKLIPPSKSTIGRWCLLGLLNYHTNAMKPDLTAACKLLRLRFSLTFIHRVGPNNKLMFKSMYNVVHIDEKWFNQKKPSMRCIYVPGEDEHYRSCNKQHIPKVMFIAAVAKPIYAIDKTCVFDGKIGVWSFTERVAAVRNSVNRAAGTMITKPRDSINKVVMKDTILNEIVPAIKAKWPHALSGKHVIIQQDNAPPHIKDDDPDFRAAASADGWDIRLKFQLANSPDMNINDLGWFRALQSLQHKTLMRNIDELIAVVQDSFTNLSDVTLSDVWLSLQACMIEVLKVRGGNNYKLPHLKKNTLRLAGTLPDNLEVDQDLVRDCMLYLMEEGGESDFEDLTEALGVTFMLS